VIGLLGVEFSDSSLPIDLFGDIYVSWHHVEYTVILYSSEFDDLLIPITG
jgi:hypothetical protein